MALVAVVALFALAAPAQAQTEPVWSTTMTVGTSSLDAVGYTQFSGTGVLADPDSFMIGVAAPYTVEAVAVGPVPSGRLNGLNFKLSKTLSSHADYTLEFAGETLPLADASVDGREFHFPETWLAANAPSLSAANFETTLGIGEEVPVCLRTATPGLPVANRAGVVDGP